MTMLKRAKCFQEIFAGPYYFGPERRSDRYVRNGYISDSDVGLDLEGLTVDKLTYGRVKKTLCYDYSNVNLVFTKELVYNLPESFYPDMISEGFTDFVHTFLIRDPEKAIPSNYKVTVNEGFGSGYLEPTSGGFEETYNLFNFIKEKKGFAPIVVDAVDLQTHPDETMKSYCEAVGIEFDPKMTTWEPGRCPSHYRIFSQWNSTVDQSTGFIKVKQEDLPPVSLQGLPNEVLKAIEKSKIFYQEMKRYCVRVTA